MEIKICDDNGNEYILVQNFSVINFYYNDLQNKLVGLTANLVKNAIHRRNANKFPTN